MRDWGSFDVSFAGVCSSTTDGQPKDAARSADDEWWVPIAAAESVQHTPRADT